MKAHHWASLALLAAVSGQASAVTYTVTDLGVLSGAVSSFANGINESGQVTGYVTDAAGLSQAFLYTPGAGMVALGTLGGVSSQGWGINDAGQVTGTAATANGVNHAFAYSGAGMVDLTPGAAGASAGYAINNQGLIAGSLGNQPMKVDSSGASSPIVLSYPSNDRNFPASSGVAYGVNAQGAVAGQANFSPANNYSLAFVTNGAGVGGPVGGVNTNTQSQANGINDLGQVVGSMSFAGTPHAVLFSGGMATDLGALCSGGFSGAKAINNLGQIVGSSQDCGASSGNSRGFLYSGGQLTDLNTLLSPQDASTWFIQRATGINESGQITGSGLIGGQVHAFVLTAVPEPSTGALMVLGLGGLVVAGRRQRK